MAEIFLPKTEEDMYEMYPKFIGQFGGRIKDRTNERIGRLTILYRTLDIINSTDNRARTQWICKCDCGNIIQRSADRLTVLEKTPEKANCNKCDLVSFYMLKELGNWYIIEHFLYNEGARSVEHTKLTCKTCGYSISPRTAYIRHNKQECMVCNAAQRSGLIGTTINNQKILSYRASNNGKSAYPVWTVECTLCGEIKEKTTAEINRQKSCGCLAGESAANAIGQKYGRLTVMELMPPNPYHNRRALCLCDCGNTTITAINNLRNGHTQSCGCLQREVQGALTRLQLDPGQQFGKLTVEEFAGMSNSGHTLWRCKCECGTEKNYLGYLLTTGAVISCGCVNSKGEEKIAQMLTANNIPFEKHKTFDTCLFPNTHAYGIFDFYVNNKYLIEYDGVQHYKFQQNSDGTKTWNTKEHYEQGKYRDEYKNKWCEENHIMLIRIPYWEFSRITIQDLLPGSRFTYIE